MDYQEARFIAEILIGGGWTSADAEDIAIEYDYSLEDAEQICEAMENLI